MPISLATATPMGFTAAFTVRERVKNREKGDRLIECIYIYIYMRNGGWGALNKSKQLPFDAL